MPKKMILSLYRHNKMQSEQGFSLLEALVGVLVITLVLVAVTPPIILSMATQVQNRRAEQALQLAQGEIDRVRSLVAQGNYTITNLPTVPTFNTIGDITSAPAPTTLDTTILKSVNTTCNTYNTGTQVSADKVLRVDLDGNNNCQPTFLVQTFRDAGVVAGTTNTQVMFHIGVRIYSAQAIKNGALTALNPATCGSLQSTSSIGNQDSRPLAAIYTTITRSDSTFVSLQKYQEFLQQPTVAPAKPACQ